MNWIVLFFKFLPLIFATVKLVESLFEDVPKSGADKKKTVIETIGTLFREKEDINSRDKAVLWEILEPKISQYIDLICAFLFPDHEDT